MKLVSEQLADAKVALDAACAERKAAIATKRRERAERKERERIREKELHRYDPKIALQRAKVETKSRKSLKKYHDRIKREGKKSKPVASSIAPISIIKSDLNIWEQTSAEDLIAAYRSSIGAPVSRDPEMIDAPVAQVRWDLADEIAAKQSDLARAYQVWRAALSDKAPFTVAKEVLFAETSLASVDKRYHWRKGTAKKHLLVALRHFASLRGNVPRYADWKFDPTDPFSTLEKSK